MTDGARWTLVWARPGESTGICTWRAELWLEEPVTLRAFVSLLGAQRFFNLPVEQGLAALLQESAGKQQEVADQLGAQVRRAVELLIATLDREDRDRHGELLADLESDEVYRGAVTVMMRLVFLFVAEERRLLPIDDPRYDETLAASTLRAQLQERADRDGEDPLERSTAAWHRVLALFRAVHGGIEHDALRLPAYGGGLFDPDRYPLLEGRPPGTGWPSGGRTRCRSTTARCCTCSTRSRRWSTAARAVLLSFRALDVEQIGHVYEGLLDHTAVRITDTALASRRQARARARPRRDRALGRRRRGHARRAARQARPAAPPAAIGKALGRRTRPTSRAPGCAPPCGSDDALVDGSRPYHAPARATTCAATRSCFLPGSLYVTQALDRRASGTHYTPRSLAEEVVRTRSSPSSTDPGPAQERDPANWKLKPAAELLELKVADIAMGSGAFLVAACRYLAERLVEAWTAEGALPRPLRRRQPRPPAARSRPTRSSARRSPTGSSPSTACTASTSTRWPSRWPSSRSG